MGQSSDAAKSDKAKQKKAEDTAPSSPKVRELQPTTALAANYSWATGVLRLTWRGVRGHVVQYFLGCGACFLVVLVVSLLVTIINNTPVVFLRLSELEQGELDIILKPGPWTGAISLNYTVLQELVAGKEEFSYHTARYGQSAFAISHDGCLQPEDPQSAAWKYPNLYDACGEQGRFNVELIVFDDDREERMGLGRDWKEPKLEEEGTALIQRSIANTLKVEQGQVVYIDISASALFGPLWDEVLEEMGPANVSDRIFFPVTIAKVFPSPDGKFGSEITSAIMMDFENFLPYIIKHLDPQIPPESVNKLASLKMYEIAGSVIFNLPPPRIGMYLSSDYDIIQKRVTEYSSELIYLLGFNQLEVEMPVLDGVGDTRFFGLFLGLILNIVIVILLFLSILLIYSLLMINVETRTFEFGVLRMMGTTRVRVIQLLLCQAFSYSIPSWALGLASSQASAVGVFAGFESLTGIPISPLLTYDAILIATALGLFIPVAAAILPIRTALGQNLFDALDIRHSKTKAVKISINRSEGQRFSWPVLIVGICLAAFGFGAYVVLPLSLLSFNFTLLLNMFFFLLLGMILGLVLLSLNIQHFLEKVLVMIFLFWEKSAIQKIVLKNLIAHTTRNRKTTIMYALSLGFIIFVNVSYSVSVDSFTYGIQQENGVFLRVSSRSGLNFTGKPNSIGIKEDLERVGNEHPKITSYSWVSAPLNLAIPDVREISITNTGHFFKYPQTVVCASPNLYSTTIDGFLKVQDRVPSENEYTIMEELYTVHGSSSMLLGALYQSELQMELKDHFLLRIESNTPGSPSITKTRHSARFFVSSSTVFTFSRFPSFVVQDAVVSMPTYVRLSKGAIESVDDIPMQHFLIRLAEDATDADIDDVIAKLDEVRVNQKELRIWDYREAVRPINTANTVMDYFFNFTTVIAMLISFFSLMSSMYTNIYEQTKEIGILRAIGIRKGWMRRIYIYEAFILVFSSSLLGLMIGLVVGYTMTAQRVLFTQLPISLVIPYLLLITVFFASILFGVLSTLVFAGAGSVLTNFFSGPHQPSDQPNSSANHADCSID